MTTKLLTWLANTLPRSIGKIKTHDIITPTRDVYTEIHLKKHYLLSADVYISYCVCSSKMFINDFLKRIYLILYVPLVLRVKIVIHNRKKIENTYSK